MGDGRSLGVYCLYLDAASWLAYSCRSWPPPDWLWLHISRGAATHGTEMFVSNRQTVEAKPPVITVPHHMRELHQTHTRASCSKLSPCYDACGLILISMSQCHSVRRRRLAVPLKGDTALLTLAPWSRVRTRSLLTCVSAMSARSSASLSSCCSFLYLVRLELACSSWKSQQRELLER